eukprot:CAMPEP_0119319786 /NCGR_PEP_ID=MMETSP1333-20130426/50361_1 /TAXON_ID=418940 /ORGANISM="Scyphosphaera apsteinii, Strain RCC1455" /LENGTH=272 /DNA_ID=CAMNT_0007326281 /DNA_START=239 /DNA_END=1054 /DNA_ORIENTATION=+
MSNVEKFLMGNTVTPREWQHGESLQAKRGGAYTGRGRIMVDRAQSPRRLCIMATLLSLPAAVGSIPRRLLFNHAYSWLNHSAALAANVENNIQMHRGWAVVLDDDVSCAAKLAAAGLSNRTQRWYRSPPHLQAAADTPFPHRAYYLDRVTKGKYMTDLCRLAQVYLLGGVYIDSDVVMLHPADMLLHWNLTTATNLGADSLNQAILAAPARSPLISKALTVFDQWVRFGTPVNGWVGPDLLRQTLLAQRMRFGTRTQRDVLRYRRGVNLLRE